MNQTTRTFFTIGALGAAFYGLYTFRQDMHKSNDRVADKITHASEYVEKLVNSNEKLYDDIGSLRQHLQRLEHELKLERMSNERLRAIVGEMQKNAAFSDNRKQKNNSE